MSAQPLTLVGDRRATLSPEAGAFAKALRAAVYEEIVHGELGQVESARSAADAWVKLDAHLIALLAAERRLSAVAPDLLAFARTIAAAAPGDLPPKIIGDARWLVTRATGDAS